jgi:membrane-associated phospholipid phosphatase
MRECLLGLCVLTVLLSATTAGAQAPADRRDAATWRPWVLRGGQDLRLPPPPNVRATASELEEVRRAAARRDPAELERIRYWDFRSPSHRWNELLIDVAVAEPVGGAAGIRAFALLNVAIHDALVSAWDSKYAHRRRRPGEMDPRLTPAVPVPRTPSYPCEHAVAAGAAAAVIAHVAPKSASKAAAAAEEAAHSRVQAGAVFPSDARAGLELGRAVAARVIEHMKLDGMKWNGAVPVGPGLWKGTDPVGIDEARWKPFVLASANQFRPGPPPGHDSPERAAELAEVKNFKRTPATNGAAYYWNFGQYGGPGVLYRLSDEVGLRLAEMQRDRLAPLAARAYALVHVAHYDAFIASQDAKYHYWTARPNEFDTTITTVFPTPPFPSYLSNATALSMAPAIVLGHLFPRESARYLDWTKQYGESRIWAGIHFRSDLEAGWELGRRVGTAVVERARRDGAE